LNRDVLSNGGAPSTILLVDEDRSLCERLVRDFAVRGFRVHAAHTAADGLAYARVNRPQDAIVAMRLPDQSGVSLIPVLLSIEGRMRIVMLTGYPSIHTAVESIKLGATYYLAKPASAVQLIAALNRAVGDANASVDDDPMSLHRIEWEHMIRTLQEHNGNISATARALSIDRRTLQRKLQKRPVPIGGFAAKAGSRIN
jgi:two-component system response regulator RegA